MEPGDANAKQHVRTQLNKEVIIVPSLTITLCAIAKFVCVIVVSFTIDTKLKS